MVPSTSEKRSNIAREFENKCIFPHCISALDGRQCIMKEFPNVGNVDFNYKGAHSIVKMGLIDTNYEFTWDAMVEYQMKVFLEIVHCRLHYKTVRQK